MKTLIFKSKAFWINKKYSKINTYIDSYIVVNYDIRNIFKFLHKKLRKLGYEKK
jgi:hypothetical protein